MGVRVVGLRCGGYWEVIIRWDGDILLGRRRRGRLDEVDIGLEGRVRVVGDAGPGVPVLCTVRADVRVTHADTSVHRAEGASSGPGRRYLETVGVHVEITTQIEAQPVSRLGPIGTNAAHKVAGKKPGIFQVSLVIHRNWNVPLAVAGSGTTTAGGAPPLTREEPGG